MSCIAGGFGGLQSHSIGEEAFTWVMRSSWHYRARIPYGAESDRRNIYGPKC